MRLIRKAHLAPGHHECAYMSYKPSERDGTWIELLLADPAKVSFISVLNSQAIWLCSVTEALSNMHASFSWGKADSWSSCAPQVLS